MKFVCRKCEAFMLFDEVESVRQDSLGVTFGCPECGARVSMVTNAGETQMVKALGVELGGRSQAPAPLELTRSILKTAAVEAPSTPQAAKVNEILSVSKESMGKCPFANALASMASGKAEAPATAKTQILWSAEALERLGRVPEFVRGFAKTMIEDMARQQGRPQVDASLMDQAKEKFM